MNNGDNSDIILLGCDMMKKNKYFDIVAILSIIFICIGFTSIQVTNDTFYTIKIGDLIIDKGIDMIDHFSWISNLPYTYPHWSYDIFINILYRLGQFKALYISNIFFYCTIGILIYFATKKRSENYLFAFILTIVTLGFLMPFVQTRAQLVSFLIFIIEKENIDKFLENPRPKYALNIILLSLLLVNIHLATWIFFFVLFLPSIASHYLTLLIKKRQKRDDDFSIGKIEFKTDENVHKLFIIIFICLLTGLCTPLGLTPYTYIFKQFLGDTLGVIAEYQNMTISNGLSFFQYLLCFILLFMMTKPKIALDDFFMISGLTLMSLMAIRSFAYLLIIGSFVISNYLGKINKRISINTKNKLNDIFKRKSELLTILICFIAAGTYLCYLNNTKTEFIAPDTYPIQATEYIKNELNDKDIHLFNNYDFGSYLLYNDVKVFIDSRSDLYTKPFNYLERDIFNDYMDVVNNLNYEEVFAHYDVTHILLYSDSDVVKLIKRDKNYEEIYKDDYFVIFKRKINDK